jgi:hypothetical protein
MMGGLTRGERIVEINNKKKLTFFPLYNDGRTDKH